MRDKDSVVIPLPAVALRAVLEIANPFLAMLALGLTHHRTRKLSVKYTNQCAL